MTTKLSDNSLKKLEKMLDAPLSLGGLIRAIRMGEEETQVEFAKKLNMSKQQLCDIERGRKSVSPKLAAFYAEQLGYSSEQFVRLCLQDMIDRDGLNLLINVTPKKRVNRAIGSFRFA